MRLQAGEHPPPRAADPDLLQLTDREVAAVSGLSPGTALWKVGQRSFVVEHLVSRAERWINHTEPREEAVGVA